MSDKAGAVIAQSEMFAQGTQDSTEAHRRLFGATAGPRDARAD